VGQVSFKNKQQILDRMQKLTVARSDLSDITDTSSVNAVLNAAAHSDAEQYHALRKIRDIQDIEKARGPDLDEYVKRFNEPELERDLEEYATGAVVFSRTGTTGTISISVGTEVKVPGTSLSFYTTELGTISAGSHDSAAVPVKAGNPGASYNVFPNTVTTFGSAPSGVDSVTNPSAFTNGLDRETDDSLRKRVRLWKKSLSRGTLNSLLYAALRTATATQRVVYAAVLEDPFNPGYVELYVDDGSGTAESTTHVVADVLIDPTVGGEIDLYTTYKPIKDEAASAFRVGGVTKTRGVDYTFDPASGLFKVTQASYPSGLPPATDVAGDYYRYTGLIEEVQKVIDGDPTDRVNYPGWRSAGVLVRAMAPQIISQSVAAVLTMKRGFDRATAILAAKAAVSAYINSLGIGEDVIFDELIRVIKNIAGVYDLSISLPTENQIVLDTQLARILDADVTIA
jgi:uncharacterized phage protein gp47/JayE